jgi:TM2 domain-containing membrane protein YozV
MSSAETQPTQLPTQLPPQPQPQAQQPYQPHHISDVNIWKGADRNFYVFAILSILFGFIGFDHFYLRSFGTGTQKALVNFATLGLWYWWDLAQVLTDGKTVRKEGLTSPLDWIRGIGRGVFTPLPDIQFPDGSRFIDGNHPQHPQPQHGGEHQTQPYPAQKSYLIYAVLAIFFGWLGADKFYLGYFGQGLAKLLSCFNIFLFLFGWLWVLWDSVFAFFFTADVMKHGIRPPLPYSFFFHEPIPPTLFEMGHKPTSETSFWDWLTCPPVPSFMKSWFSFLPAVNSAQDVYNGVVKPLLTPPLTATLATMEHTNPGTIEKVEEITEKIRQIGGGGSVSNEVDGGSGTGGAGSVIAGTLTALILAGGLKGTYDFISKQYG